MHCSSGKCALPVVCCVLAAPVSGRWGYKVSCILHAGGCRVACLVLPGVASLTQPKSLSCPLSCCLSVEQPTQAGPCGLTVCSGRVLCVSCCVLGWFRSLGNTSAGGSPGWYGVVDYVSETGCVCGSQVSSKVPAERTTVV